MVAVVMQGDERMVLLQTEPLLVMGVGGHRFTDYTKVGLPLTFLIFLVVLFVPPLVWPLQ